MKVYVYPADATGCGHLRLIWPARALRAAGHDIEIIMPDARAAALSGVLSPDKTQLVDVRVPPDADVIVLQRITHRFLVEAVRILHARGVAVVIDMDDDLAAIDPRNPAFRAMHPRHGMSEDHSWHNAQLACEAATLVTVSTDSLLVKYAPHGRGRVLRNCVPGQYLAYPRVDGTHVGWAGSLHSHPGDLEVTGTALAQVTRESGPLHIVGYGEGVRRTLLLDEEPVATGPRHIDEEWPEAINRLGTGIAPLAPTKFNESKSWLKPLEYAALGVPCVMSPSPEYVRLNAQGVGWLASKPKQWLRHLRTLVQSADARAELSEAGREVASRWTIEDNAWRWAEAWEDAYKTVQTGMKTHA